MKQQLGPVYSGLGRRALLNLMLGVCGGALVPLGVMRAATAQDDDSKLKIPKYKPMGRGAPGGRIGGATRGSPPETLKMLAVAPDHVAYASNAQPTLYWFLSEPIRQASFSLRPIEATEAIVSKADITGRLERGVLALKLSDYGVTLEPEKVYEWSVSLAADQPKDISAASRGLIAFRSPTEKMTRQIAKAKPDEAVFLHASNGYWYDAINVISQLIEQNPTISSYRLIRAGLVEQARLFDVADLDRGDSSQ